MVSPAVASYLKIYDLAALVVDTAGVVKATRDVRDYTVVGWTTATAAAMILKQLEAEESTDVVGIARGLRINLTPHERVMERVTAIVARADKRIEILKATGALRDLHARYRQERLKAKAEGRGYPSFSVVRARLRRVLFRRVADGSVVNGRALVDEVFAQQ